jgi:hypothetical protein
MPFVMAVESATIGELMRDLATAIRTGVSGRAFARRNDNRRKLS